MRMPVGGENKGHGVLRNRLGGVSGNTENPDPVFGSGFQIHVIVARASHKDNFYALSVKLFNYFCAKVGVYEGADSVVSSREGSRLFVNIRLNKFDRDSRIFRGQLIKTGRNLWFRRIEFS